jgi:DNA-binding CsgD family transcriptional regulator
MNPDHGLKEVLSKREVEVLRLIAEGRTSREIASNLHISKDTVSSHRKRICHKLGIHSTAQLILYAVSWLQANASS